MFAKLLKNELNSVAKWYLIVNAIVLVLAPLLGLFIRANINNNSQDIPAIIALTGVLAFIFLISFSALSTLYLIIRRFYNNIFGKEGYLTLTLPVTTHHIIITKIISAILWTLFNTTVILLSIFLILLPIINNGNMPSDFIPSLLSITELFQGVSPILYFTSAFISVITSILTIYMAASIGQLVSNHRGIMGIGAYFIISISHSLLYSILSLLIGIDSSTGLTNAEVILTILMNLIVGAIAYITTYYIIQKKLNIQ